MLEKIKTKKKVWEAVMKGNMRFCTFTCQSTARWGKYRLEPNSGHVCLSIGLQRKEGNQTKHRRLKCPSKRCIKWDATWNRHTPQSQPVRKPRFFFSLWVVYVLLKQVSHYWRQHFAALLKFFFGPQALMLTMKASEHEALAQENMVDVWLPPIQ